MSRGGSRRPEEALQRAVIFTVPGPPVGKGRPRFTKSGHTYTPARTRSWESLAKHEASLVMWGRVPFTGPVAVTVTATLAIPSSWPKSRQLRARLGFLLPCVKPDSDNLCKAALDSLSGIVLADDKQAVDVRVVKRYGPTPGVTVEVASLEPEEVAE